MCIQGDGDNAAYWRVMGEGGVSRERLESFARNITLEPEHFPHCKDALIHDFQEYLRVLKSVHAGTDLGVAARTARNNGLPDSAQVRCLLVSLGESRCKHLCALNYGARIPNTGGAAPISHRDWTQQEGYNNLVGWTENQFEPSNSTR